MTKKRHPITRRLFDGWVSSLLGAAIIAGCLVDKFLQPQTEWSALMIPMGFGAVLLFIHDPAALKRLKGNN